MRWLDGITDWMDMIKDRHGEDLTEAEEIKKRWQEYTEELYKKDLHDLDNHDGVITHLEPEIEDLEPENEDHGIRSHHFVGNRWGNSVRLYFWGGLQNHCRW